jgi:hypothetical protein
VEVQRGGDDRRNTGRHHLVLEHGIQAEVAFGVDGLRPRDAIEVNGYGGLDRAGACGRRRGSCTARRMPHPTARDCDRLALWRPTVNQVSVLDPTPTLADELRTRWLAFALVRPVVGLGGLGPPPSSLSAKYREPPFPQVTLDRGVEVKCSNRVQLNALPTRSKPSPVLISMR